MTINIDTCTTVAVLCAGISIVCVLFCIYFSNRFLKIKQELDYFVTTNRQVCDENRKLKEEKLLNTIREKTANLNI